MAYSNIAREIYRAIKDDICAEITRCEVDFMDGIPVDKSFVAKYNRGVVIRTVSDNLQDTASDNYDERLYTFLAIA